MSKFLLNMVKENDCELIKKLFEEGYQLKESDTESLIEAIHRGNLETVKFLIDKGKMTKYPLKNISDIYKNVTNVLNLDVCLSVAVECGEFDIVLELLHNDVDVHANNDYAIQKACELGFLNIAKVLVIRGANIHASNEYALRWASIKGHIDVVKFLITKGADLSYIDSALIPMIPKTHRLSVIELLPQYQKKKILESII